MKFFRLLLSFVFVATAAYASPTLKPAQIESFIVAFPKVQTWMGQKHIMKKLLAKPSNTAERPATPFEKILNDPELNSEFETLLKPHGFLGGRDFIASWGEIQRIYMALTSTKQQRLFIEKFKQQLNDIKTQDLSEEQRAFMQEQLQKQLQRYQKLFSVTEEEKQLFKPYMKELRKLLK